MTTTSGPQAPSEGLRVNGVSPWAWALQRALLGLMILTAAVGGALWIYHLAIEFDRVGAANEPSFNQTIAMPAQPVAPKAVTATVPNSAQ